jgi:hypothetical protein
MNNTFLLFLFLMEFNFNLGLFYTWIIFFPDWPISKIERKAHINNSPPPPPPGIWNNVIFPPEIYNRWNIAMKCVMWFFIWVKLMHVAEILFVPWKFYTCLRES